MADTTVAQYPEGKEVLVVGGGAAGMTAAIEAAEAGCRVILIDKTPSLGGRVSRTNLYFPKLCPPSCGLEINYRRIRSHSRIRVLTLAELEHLSGSPGDYQATVRVSPRFVTEACTLCDACAQACPAERPNEFDFGMSRTKAAYLPHTMAFPPLYVIDREACRDGCTACTDACRYGAVDLNQQVRRLTFNVAAVVAATGWMPYDAAKIENLGFGKYENVITNVMMERLAAPNGPTAGKILRPSDGQPPESVAFVQCAGSRDDKHLPYCSAVCCAASLKQASYVRSLYPQAKITIFYSDIRTPGRLEDFYARIAEETGVELIKGKVAKVEGDAGSGNLRITAEDVMSGGKTERAVGLVVLATGIVPQTEGLPAGFCLDEFNFISQSPGTMGLYAAGCVRRPVEVSAAVQDGTAAALKALQCVARGGRHE